MMAPDFSYLLPWVATCLAVAMMGNEKVTRFFGTCLLVLSIPALIIGTAFTALYIAASLGWK
jgi:hypothetical protein